MKKFDSFLKLGGIVHGVFDKSDVPAGEYDRDWYEQVFPQMNCEKLGFKNLALPKQKHTSDVVTVTEKNSFENRSIADGIVTIVPNLVIGVQTADCGAILLADAENKVIGACHAGWKGATGQVIENTIAEMEKLGANRSQIKAGLGPMIFAESYEVDVPVYEEAIQKDVSYEKYLQKKSDGKWLFDVRALIVSKLKNEAVENIEAMPMNTYAHPDCFSYRLAQHQFPHLPVKKRLDGKRKFSLIGLK